VGRVDKMGVPDSFLRDCYIKMVLVSRFSSRGPLMVFTLHILSVHLKILMESRSIIFDTLAATCAIGGTWYILIVPAVVHVAVNVLS